MSDIYEAHRPLKNLIASYRLDDTLDVVRAYSQHLAFGTPLPNGVEPPRDYRDFAGGIHQWELEIIAREALAYGKQYHLTNRTLRQAQRMADLLNRLRELENHVGGLTINSSNARTELHRIGHRQFEWQAGMPSTHQILRNYKIFAHPDMQPIVAESVGLETRTIYLIGFLLTGLYLDKFALNYPPTFLLSGDDTLSLEEFDAFLRHFSLPLADLRKRAAEETANNMNENFAYFLNPLRMYPTIDMEVSGKRSLVAPLPVLLIWRFTRGLYYELYDHSGFANAFGGAFQSYVGEVLTDLFTDTTHTVLPEEPTAHKRGVPSSDWFLITGESALVVEAKTKRMGLAAKITLNDTAKLDEEIGKLADGVFQAYKCVDAIRQGKFLGPGYAELAGKRLYPVVVTLESWHLFGPTWQKLKELVNERLGSAGLPVEWTETIPFTACDIGEFELLAQAIQAADGIDAILDERVTSRDFEQHELHNYLYNNRRSTLDRARELFPNQFNTLLTEEYQIPRGKTADGETPST